MTLVVALLLPLLSLASLRTAATPAPTPAQIPPIIWQAVAITDAAGATTDITEPGNYTVQFLPDGSLLTRADCNHGRSTFELADGKLAMRPGMSTLALCPPDSHDRAFLAALNGRRRSLLTMTVCCSWPARRGN